MSTHEVHKMSQDEYRRKLACLIDRSKRDLVDKHSLMEQAVDFVSQLPALYGDELDRKSMWERINNGLLAAAAKADGDGKLFVNAILSYIKAEATKVATNDRITGVIVTMEQQDDVWVSDFIRQIQSYHYIIIARARKEWQLKKKGAYHA